MRTMMAEAGRAALIGLGCTMLVPGALLLAVAAFFALSPIAVVGIPFMLPTFFGHGLREHREEAAWHARMHPAPAAAH